MPVRARSCCAMHNRSCIWLTRPQADSEAFAAQLSGKNIGSIVAPVLSVGSVVPPELAAASRPDALLLTSRHAVPSLAQKHIEWADIPVYCVGEATAAHVQAAGFAHTIAGDTDVMTLLTRITSELAAGSSITYLSGDQTRVDVAALVEEDAWGRARGGAGWGLILKDIRMAER